jgi:hypothetical protein
VGFQCSAFADRWYCRISVPPARRRNALRYVVGVDYLLKTIPAEEIQLRELIMIKEPPGAAVYGRGGGRTEIRSMERRTFLLGFIGSLAAATLAPAVAAPSQPLTLAPQTPSEAVEAAEVSAYDLDDVRTEHTQYYRRRARRVYRRYVRRPYRRYRRRARRYWRRGRWYYY